MHKWLTTTQTSCTILLQVFTLSELKFGPHFWVFQSIYVVVIPSIFRTFLPIETKRYSYLDLSCRRHQCSSRQVKEHFGFTHWTLLVLLFQKNLDRQEMVCWSMYFSDLSLCLTSTDKCCVDILEGAARPPQAKVLKLYVCWIKEICDGLASVSSHG